jgi:hypothetical protein
VTGNCIWGQAHAAELRQRNTNPDSYYIGDRREARGSSILIAAETDRRQVPTTTGFGLMNLPSSTQDYHYTTCRGPWSFGIYPLLS